MLQRVSKVDEERLLYNVLQYYSITTTTTTYDYSTFGIGLTGELLLEIYSSQNSPTRENH